MIEPHKAGMISQSVAPYDHLAVAGQSPYVCKSFSNTGQVEIKKRSQRKQEDRALRPPENPGHNNKSQNDYAKSALDKQENSRGVGQGTIWYARSSGVHGRQYLLRLTQPANA